MTRPVVVEPPSDPHGTGVKAAPLRYAAARSQRRPLALGGPGRRAPGEVRDN